MTDMMESASEASLSLIWGTLRNILDFENVTIKCNIRLVGSVKGSFPAETYRPIPLEVPQEHEKQDVSGRFNGSGASVWDSLNKADFSFGRAVHLPLYHYEEDIEDEQFETAFRALIEEWDRSFIPENIPCSALAIRTQGGYCDEREAQYVNALLLWNNNTARILNLEWFEGPLEDCISPEWYLRSSKLLPLAGALQETHRWSCQLPSLQNAKYSLFIIPTWFGKFMRNGMMCESSQNAWEHQWDYYDLAAFTQDLDTVLYELEKVYLPLTSSHTL